MGDILGGPLPLQRQWEGQHEAFLQYGKDNKNCDQLVVERPGWAFNEGLLPAGDDKLAKHI
jgi:hypothetical protein